MKNIDYSTILEYFTLFFFLLFVWKKNKSENWNKPPCNEKDFELELLLALLLLSKGQAQAKL